ncbi:MAG: glycosyltransferase family 4 protein [Candidatus Chryseobacterium colombiense]|nr:glycosyltransferase family 4 protein [Chryseobacterium sp.]WEK71724.1 MAG: glycosyltransferase family 4 protein [Chryseobacterium sp.]
MRSKKKIAFLLPSLGAGGAERVGVLLANKFSDKFNVFLIAFTKAKAIYKVNDNVQLIYLQDTFSHSVSFFQAIRNNFFLLKKVVKIIRLNKIDILIGFTTNVNIITVLCAYFLRIPNIISERNNPKVYVPNFFWRNLRNLTYHLTDGLVVQTEFINDFYKNIISNRKIITIPNPIDESVSSSRLVYKERENIILTVGRLDSNKNQKMLIEAFANLNVDGWKLVIVGDGILKDEYVELVISLGIDHRVDFVGNVQNVWDYYNQAKIFAFTSNSEGFPNALLEAMSFGLPCISTDCPSGPSEIILNDENGYLIEMGNIEQLEDRLSILMHNPDICDQFSKKAMASTKKFSMAEVKKLWEVQIQKIL